MEGCYDLQACFDKLCLAGIDGIRSIESSSNKSQVQTKRSNLKVKNKRTQYSSDHHVLKVRIVFRIVFHLYVFFPMFLFSLLMHSLYPIILCVVFLITLLFNGCEEEVNANHAINIILGHPGTIVGKLAR